MAAMRKRTSSGFTLTELSIVLIIMGLLIASIVSGAKFIDFAKARALIAHSDEHQSHLYGFLSKYSEYPGDFTEASIYWAGASPENGDGDGKILFQNGANVQEGYNAWQHLALAGMAENDFIGSGGALTDPLPDTHIPAAVYKGAAFFWSNDYAGHTDKNTLVVGKPKNNTDTTLNINSAFLQESAKEIDLKADDGNPSQGTVKAIEGADGTAGDCVNQNGTSSDTSDDSYNTAIKSFSCTIAFMTASQ